MNALTTILEIIRGLLATGAGFIFLAGLWLAGREFDPFAWLEWEVAEMPNPLPDPPTVPWAMSPLSRHLLRNNIKL